MYKLQGHSLTRGPWFLPESQSLTLSEKSSTSTITMPMDSAVQIDFNDWLYDEDVPGGDPIVWRVKSISESSNTNTVTVELEHVIRLLEDQQIFGEVTTEDISGGTSCTARQAIEYLLSGNFDWQLGALEVDNSCPYEFETLSVYDAIESVTDTLEGVYWEYDLTQHPFILNVRLLEKNPDCEMREGRNLSTLKRSVSRTGMYTRIYPIGENDLHIPGDYISNNEEIYGRIDKVVTDSTKTTIENLGAWAHGLLMHNSDPDVTITVSGLELSESTGEPMDRLRLNRFCRCPLPEYATTIIERITKLYWKDLIKDRESVTVTLANNMKELSEIIKTESNKASGGSGAAGQAKQNYLFQANGEHLLYEVFDENGHLHGVLRMTSESLRVAFENLNESTRSEFRLTSESLRISFENEIRSTRSEFQMTSESLRIHFENEISSTRSEFQLTSESMRVEFQNEISSTRSEFQLTSESMRIEFQNGIASTRSLVEQTDRSWRASVEGVADSDGKITAASISVAINESDGTSEARIDAGHVYIGNDKSTTVIAGKITLSEVSADYIKGKIADIPMVTAQALLVRGTITTNDGLSAVAVYANHNDISNPIMEASVSGNVLTLTKADGSTTTFSKAVSLSGDWNGSYQAGKKFVVTVSPSGVGSPVESPTVNSVAKYGNPTWASDEHSFDQQVLVQDSDGNSIYLGTINVTGITKGTFSSVQVSPIDNGKWIRVDSTAVTLYNAGTATVYDRGDSLIGREVLSSGGTFYYPAGTAATYYKAGSSTVYARGDSLTGREVLSSGGTFYYPAGTAATYYNAGSSTVTARGDSVTARQVYATTGSDGTSYYQALSGADYYEGDGGTFTEQGEYLGQLRYWGQGTLFNSSGETQGWHAWYYSSSAGSHVYYAGSAVHVDRGTKVTINAINTSTKIRLGTAQTFYKGNGGSYTVQGSAVSVTPINSNAGIRIGAAATYYKGNGGSYTVQGSAVSVTPINSNAGIRLGAAATYYKGNGGSKTVQGTAQDAYKKLSSGGTLYYQNAGSKQYYTKA